MKKFRHRPVVIDAEQFQWRDGDGIPDIPGVRYREWQLVDVGHGLKKNAPVTATAYVETLEGPLKVTRGDWIIRGVKGERYPCKPDVFRATYEPVEEGADAIPSG